MNEQRLIDYCRNHSALEIQDVFKYLYQSCFGCEHLVSDEEKALQWICEEAKQAACDDLPPIELFEGDFCRVHLKVLAAGKMSPQTFCRLFLLSAQKQTDGRQRLEQALEALPILAENGSIPFSKAETEKAILAWREHGLCAVHHSENYRMRHHPAYRVIKKEYLRYLPLFSAIDALTCSTGKENILVSLEGRCASGKTTLSEMLKSVYDCNLFHMDDFFLRPEQRTAERLSIPGENVDHERFLEEVLRPISERKTVAYRKYNCHKNEMEEPIQMPSKRLNIVEGVYSQHPQLKDMYDLRVFLDITAEEQRKRILTRNTSDMAKRFFSVWIPLEEKYFSACAVRDTADLIL